MADKLASHQYLTAHKCSFFVLYCTKRLFSSSIVLQLYRWLVRTTAIATVLTHTHTHTHNRLTALCPGLPRWADTRKVKPIWILLKQETMSGSGISWAICKSAPCCRRQPRQHPTSQFFTGWMPFMPPNQQRQSTEGKRLLLLYCL